VRLALAFTEPCAEDCDGLVGEDRGALLVAFADHAHVRAGGEGGLGDGQVDEFGDADAGLDGEEQHRVVAAPDPCGSIRRREQRVDLAAVEVGDGGLAVACGGDLKHSGDAGGVLGVAQSGLSPVGRYPQQAAGGQGFRRKVRGWFDDRLRIISMPADLAFVLFVAI
jgi:hypothetical protein